MAGARSGLQRDLVCPVQALSGPSLVATTGRRLGNDVSRTPERPESVGQSTLQLDTHPRGNHPPVAASNHVRIQPPPDHGRLVTTRAVAVMRDRPSL